MVVLPEHTDLIGELTYREINRLQGLSHNVDILRISGKRIEDIIQMNCDVAKSHIISHGSIDYGYSIPWLTQVALKKGVSSKDLRIDDPQDTVYSTKPHILLPITQSHTINSVVSLISDEWIFNWFVRNIDMVCDMFYLLQKSIDSKKDILILSNHATWFNLPLIAHCLHRVLCIPKENIYTILGPAIMHSHWNMAGILRYSNAIKTYPDTPKANTGYSGTQSIRDNFIGKIDHIFREKNQQDSSRILLLSPSGTTDKINSDGTIIMSQPSKGTDSLIRVLLRRYNMLGFVIGVNDINIIESGCSRPHRGDVYIQIAPVDYTNWKSNMPDMILDQSRNSIGKWK